MEERCFFIWATTENGNKYDTIFQLRGSNTLEAMRYNSMTMAPRTCIDMYMIRIFDTHETNFIDKKTKKPFRFTELKDQQFIELLDKEKLRRTSVLFAHVLYSRHWWLYVLDVANREFYIVDSVFGGDHDQQRQKLHRFGCNVLDQLQVWAGAKSLIKKGSNALQLRPVNVPKQPNPTDCGVYVMKWLETLDAAALSGAYTFNVQCMVEKWDQDQLDGFREQIIAKVLLNEHNTLNFEAMNQSRTMTREAITKRRTKLGCRPKPSATLKSPFLNPSTAELEKKH
ncbi:hypothetical protein PIB30_007420 [Stylosanthes scabra]|uniref:Ubiquitin-like protease family profile domain-containing protein n=1 Tax=Stylosanthes scabra TaxID=79078 RepID=A0ABU6Q5G7_9FABA|nr:hypothetical protein [Stylosanthes scabra]